MSNELKLPNYKSPDFILQNLSFVSDCYEDISATVSSRAATFDIIAYQVLFYLQCVLRGFLNVGNREHPPSILVCGAGHLGSVIIKKLLDCDCGSLLRVFSRGDGGIEKWKEKGLNCSCDVDELLSSHHPDIIILCINLSGFPTFCRDIVKYVSSTTFIISTTFGLEPKRIYHMLRAPGVLRTHTEPEFLKERMQKTKIFTKPSTKLISLKHALGSQTPIDELTRERQDTNLDSIYPHKLMSNYTSPISYAASLLVNGTFDVRNIIHLLENYYAIHNMPHQLARATAIMAVLGSECEVSDSNGGHGTGEEASSLNDGVTDSNTITFLRQYTKARNIHAPIFDPILLTLDSHCCLEFKSELSKFIRIVDLPSIEAMKKGVTGSSPTKKVSKLTGSGGRKSSLYLNDISKTGKKMTFLEKALAQQMANKTILTEAMLLSIFTEHTLDYEELLDMAHAKNMNNKPEIDVKNPEFSLYYSTSIEDHVLKLPNVVEKSQHTSGSGMDDLMMSQENYQLNDELNDEFDDGYGEEQGELGELMDYSFGREDTDGISMMSGLSSSTYVSESPQCHQNNALKSRKLKETLDGEVTSESKSGRVTGVRVRFPDAVPRLESADLNDESPSSSDSPSRLMVAKDSSRASSSQSAAMTVKSR